MILVFDTETSGLPAWRLPADHPSQPRLVQLAALLLDDSLEEHACFSAIVRPDGWTIPKEASDLHGITTEMACDLGLPLRFVLSTLVEFAARIDLRVAHNLDFDDLIVTAAFKRNGLPHTGWAGGFCTMRAMTPLCKLPGKYDDYKWPKLQEAHVHCFGREFDRAHNAAADVRACAQIYRWLRGREAALSFASDDTEEIQTNLPGDDPNP